MEGTIEKGDEVLSINGQTLKNVKHSDATAVLRQARELKQAVVVVCKNKESSTDASTAEARCSIGAEQSFIGTIPYIILLVTLLLKYMTSRLGYIIFCFSR